jgi:DNA-binding beta-propeller fold protein YncE
MRVKRSAALLLLALALCLCFGTASAQAVRTLLTEEALPSDPSGGGVEDACGLAIDLSGRLHVSDYYNGLIRTYERPSQFPSEHYEFKSSVPVASPPEGPCQIALSLGGALYANVWHQGVMRIDPSFQTFDIENSTGVAVDLEGNVYVNDRTHINVYSPSGEPLEAIGEGSLKDAYGLAVFEGKVYVPDAGTGTIKVFEPKVDPVKPKLEVKGDETPQGRFVSLVDAAVAIDFTTGHLLVLDNLQPGYEHPQAAVDEFEADGTFIGQLPQRVIDGGPSGLAVDPLEGSLFVTSGNSEDSNVFAWSAYSKVGGGESEQGPPGGSDAEQRSAGLQSEAPEVGTVTPAVAAQSSGPRPHKRKRHRHPRRRRALGGKELAPRR